MSKIIASSHFWRPCVLLLSTVVHDISRPLCPWGFALTLTGFSSVALDFDFSSPTESLFLCQHLLDSICIFTLLYFTSPSLCALTSLLFLLMLRGMKRSMVWLPYLNRSSSLPAEKVGSSLDFHTSFLFPPPQQGFFLYMAIKMCTRGVV